METISIQQVQDSFAKVFARKATLSDRFYHHLFAELPELKPLFKEDLSRQRDMFEAMLARTIRELTSPGGLAELSELLLRSHARFQLTDQQLEVGEKALVAALEDTMGENLSPAEKSAWESAISRLVASIKPSGQYD